MPLLPFRKMLEAIDEAVRCYVSSIDMRLDRFRWEFESDLMEDGRLRYRFLLFCDGLLVYASEDTSFTKWNINFVNWIDGIGIRQRGRSKKIYVGGNVLRPKEHIHDHRIEAKAFQDRG